MTETTIKTKELISCS